MALASYGVQVIQARSAAHAHELARFDLDFAACAWDIEPGALIKRQHVLVFGGRSRPASHSGFAMLPVLRIEYPQE